MLLRRPLGPPKAPESASAPPVFDLEVIDVTRLEMVLDTGLPLQFDLEKGHSFKPETKWMVVKLGKRTIRIAAHRILYFETYPHQMKRPLTAEQIQSIKQK